MSTTAMRQESIVESVLEVEVAEPVEAEHQAKLARAAQARIRNMSLDQLERFVAATEKSEGRPYRDQLVTDQLKFQLRDLRAKATTAMQCVVDQELRLKAQAWHRRLLRMLRSKDLLIPLGASVVMAVFWTVWYSVAGHVPATESIPLTPSTSLTLPFAMTRWLDVPCTFAALWLIAKSFAYIKANNTGEAGDLAGGLIFGLAGGLASGLIVGPAFGLAVGLTVGLAPTLPIWLPPALTMLWLTRRMLKKQRGW